jgi:hypothetical protein
LIYSFKIPSFAKGRSKLKIMKYFNIFLVILFLATGCKEAKNPPVQAADEVEQKDLASVGAPISDGEVLGGSEMAVAYAELNPGDTLMTRFEGEVLEVCQNKGCWMRVALPEEQSVMVRFKDYGFFVPKDIAGKTVLMEGKAFVSEVSEEERRHLAEDAGQPDSLLSKITGPQMQVGFEASGVRIFP